MPRQQREPLATSPVFVVYGSDAFLRREAVANLTGRLLGPSPDPLQHSTFASDTDAAAVLDELRTLSLVGGSRLVLVDDADEFVKRNRDLLERYCQDPSPTAYLLLACRSFDQRTRLFKAVSRLGGAVRCEPPRSAAIPAWIKDRSAQMGKGLDHRTASFIQHLVGDDLDTLDSELGKLVVFVGDRRQITRDDVAQLVGRHREQKVFAVGEALVRRDPESALSLWRQLNATDPAAVFRAVGGMAWIIRRYLEGKVAVEGGGSYAQAARKLWKDPAELRALLDPLPLPALEDLLCGLLQADLDVKTGLGTTTSAVEKLLLRHCPPQA